MASRQGRRGRRSTPRRPKPDSTLGSEDPSGHTDEVGTPVAPAPSGGLAKADAIAVGCVAAVAALIFLSTFSTRVALGDAPESVAGGRALGILHAPGYPTYVLAAHAFGDLVPIGSWPLRVNLFSLVCATLMVAGTFLLARSFGASRAGCAIGALSLATSASFWFNADFAKHYAFSGLLVTASAVLVLRWQHNRRGWCVVLAAALLGACSGSSWEAALIMAVGLVVFVAFSPHRPSIGTVIAAVAAAVALTAGVWTFVILRARQQPAVDWGDATNLPRVLRLISQADFSGGVSATNGGSLLGRGPLQTTQYVAIIARDVGLGAFALAAVGAVVAFRTLSREKKLFLSIVAVLNIVAAGFVTGIDRINGFLTGLISGGYLLDVLIVMVVLIGLATTAAVEVVSATIVNWRVPARYAARREEALSRTRSRVLAAVAVIVLVPSLLIHFHSADHRMPPMADRFGHRVLSALPAHAVLFLVESDFEFPLLERQVVDHERRDVTIVVIDQLQLQWYRDLLTRQFHLGSTLRNEESVPEIVALIDKFRETRPVYLDASAMRILRETVGYRADGLVGEVVAGKGAQTASNPKQIAATLQSADLHDGLAGGKYFRFPNFSVYFLDERAHIELAKQFILANDLNDAETELQRAGQVEPIDSQVRLLAQYIKQHPDQARGLILNL
jgi:hypothetical protein